MALLAAYALAGVFAAASAFWEARGTVGLSVDYGMNVRAVSPGGPAARAGIVRGDRIDLARTPFEERRYVAGVATAAPIGTVVHLRLRDREQRDVVLTAVADTATTAGRSSLLLVCVASLIFIVVGAALIVLRPSRATWGFGLYCLLVLPTASYPSGLPSAVGALAAIGFFDVVQNVGVVGLLVFALEFPRRRSADKWRERIYRALPGLFVVLAAMTLYPDVVNLLLGNGAGVENHLLQVVFGTVFGLALAILWDTYRHIATGERERMRWVLVGFSFGLMANYLGNTIIFSSLIPIDPPVWLVNVLISLNVLLPLTVAHAVIRHRVLDIDFVLARTLVYAALTATLAALFALLDWLLGHVLEDFRFSQLVEAAISIGIAFAFEAVHKRVERFIEALFFAQRRAAEARLDRLAGELPRARAVEVVEKTLVGEVVDAFALTSAAFFARSDAGFRRTAAWGWHDADCTLLDDTDLLVLALRGVGCVRVAELPWRRTDVPSGAAAPVVALRMQTRGDLTGVVLYGGHPAGSDVDPTELAQLERLVRAAGVAIDEIDAERLRGDNACKTAMIHELAARLDELRRLSVQRESVTAGDGGTRPLP